MKIKIVNGGVLNLKNRNIFVKDPRCEKEQCKRINKYIQALFDAYEDEYRSLPRNNVWQTIKRDNELIYLSFKIDKDGTKRVLICYRDIIYRGSDLRDLIHISLNENGSMHLTFDYIDDVKENKNVHIFSNKNPDINDGLYDLIEFIDYVKNNIFYDNNVLEILVSYVVSNPNSGWYLYFTKEFEQMKETYPDINIQEARSYFLDVFRRKYYEILEKFKMVILSESNNRILRHINARRRLAIR